MPQSDGLAPGGGDTISGAQAVDAFTLTFNGTTWDRLRAVNGLSDGVLTGLLGDGVFVFNGTTWDRLRAVNGLSDGVLTGLLGDGVFVFNGTTWDRLRAGTATGSVLVNNPTSSNFLATVQRGLADSVQLGGKVTAPGIGVAVATGTLGTAGTYEIFVTVGTGTAATSTDVGNMLLNKNSVSLTYLANPANNSVTIGPFRVTVVSTDSLSVTAAATGTAAVVYTATIAATRIG